MPTDYGLASELLGGGRAGAQGLTDLKLGPAPVDPKLQREVARQVKDDEGSSAAPAATLNGAATGSGAATPAAGADAKPGTQGDSTMAAATSDDVAMKSDATPTAVDFAADEPKAAPLPELVSPFPAELPPYPNALRTIDVMREVEKVREARKRIRLGAEAYGPGAVESQVIRTDGRKSVTSSTAAKPSVCLFTVHDAGDR